MHNNDTSAFNSTPIPHDYTKSLTSPVTTITLYESTPRAHSVEQTTPFTKSNNTMPDTTRFNTNVTLSSVNTSSHDFSPYTSKLTDSTTTDLYADCSLLLEGDASLSTDFPDIADSSFREIENMSLDDDLLLADDLIRNQVGAGSDDYNIKIVNERTLKDMKAVDVNYQLTFNNKFFREKKKLGEVKDILRDAFEKMINHVKKNLRPGDIMRGAIHNQKLDIPIYVPCRPMEEMDAEAMMESVVNVLNSNEDIPFDSTCRIDIGAIKHPRGGKGVKMTNIEAGSINKKSIVQIKNTDNLCLLRAALVAYCGVCRTSKDEYKRIKRMHPTLTPAEILIQFEKCPKWYY